MYIEVILPLPIHSTFTYSVPEPLKGDVKVGSRVLVQFGKKKFYTAIVLSTHSNPPKGYEVKDIMTVFDPMPVVRYPQLKLWEWIADYYLCTIGDVYKAAVPTGLKPESETFLVLNEEYEPNPEAPFTPSPKQLSLLEFLQMEKKAKLSAIEEKCEIKNIGKVISPLLDAGLIEIDEKVVDRYRPVKKTYIEIELKRGDGEGLREILDKTKRSRQQERVVLAWLELSGWLSPHGTLNPVEKNKLLEQAEASPAILNGLIKKGIFRVVTKTVNRFDIENEDPVNLVPLSEAQQVALDSIREGFKRNSIQLLHGVTGSGKTEIYTHLIAETLKRGDQVLYLVPEIALTTQLTHRLKQVLGKSLIVYHSKFSDAERVDIWKKLLSTNEPLVVLGVRSSVFLPFARLGLVIIDEEHESSYKQYDPAPRYNARDTAMMLASMHGAKTLLGSATPTIETFYKATTGKYGLVSLNERFDNASLPDIDVVDMKSLRKKKEVKGILSSPLRQRLLDTIGKGQQSILFQNRRGFAPVVVCGDCGWSPKCHNCDVSLIYHKSIDLLRCHYCGYSMTLPKLCPACGQNTINIYGYGTERIAEEVKEELHDARVVRMDLDTTRNKNAYERIIDDFARHETDILVGTQMVTKGLDFNDVTTVGVLNADTLLNYPDFRSNERAFNMLEQVGGRAGRRNEKGLVIIQTFNPDNSILKYVRNHDYQDYYRNELTEREKYNYPPFTKIINIYIKNKDREVCKRGAVAFAMALRNVFGDRVLGPEEPYVSRIANYYLETIMLKIETQSSMKKVKNILREVQASISGLPEIRTSIIYFDVDPV